MEQLTKAKIYNIMRHYNQPEGFEVQGAAYPVINAYTGEDEVMILPADVKKAWFRMIYPKGHCEDEAFGICDSTVANVKVTIYATGDKSEELSHAYASRCFTPGTADAEIPECTRALYLYSAAVGIAKSKALTEAGIGMGYFQSAKEFAESLTEDIDTLVTKCVQTDKKAKAETQTLRSTAEAPAIEEQEQPVKQTVPKVRKTEAAVAESKVKELENSIKLLCDLSLSCTKASDPEIARKVKETFDKETEKARKLREDIAKRIMKATASNNTDLLNVVSFEYLNSIIEKAPDGVFGVKTERKDVTLQMPEKVTSEETLKTGEKADKEPDEAMDKKQETEITVSDYKNHVLTSEVGKFKGKALMELSADELKFILIKADRGLMCEEDVKAAIGMLKTEYPEHLDVCRRRCLNLDFD